MGHPSPAGTGAPPEPTEPTAAPVPVHPEPVPGDDRALRWSVPAGTLAFVGVPGGLPAPLARLVEDGVLTAVTVEPAAVCTTLAGHHTWRAQGAAVREALQAGLADPAGWAPPDGGGDADDVLRMAVHEVIDGEVGDYIRSHGGRVELVEAHGGEVELRLSGACTHCPASGSTLGERVETALRARYPDLRSLTARQDTGLAGGRRLLGLRPTSRA